MTGGGGMWGGGGLTHLVSEERVVMECRGGLNALFE